MREQIYPWSSCFKENNCKRMRKVVIQTPNNVQPGTAPNQNINRIRLSISLVSSAGLPMPPG